MLDVIKELCNINDISMSELECKAGLKKGTIGRWDESSPSIKKVKKVADYFHVSIDYLLGNVNSDAYSDINPLVFIKKKADSGELTKEDMVKIIQVLTEELGKG